MATSSNDENDSGKTNDQKEKTDDVQENPILYWKLAREGISLLLNNKQKEAEALFKTYPEDLNMCTGYVYAVFVDALMTFEDDKIKICMTSMKELEKKCSLNTSWVKMVKSKVFGSNCGCTQKDLECQIILADTQVFLAMLTFLQQDISGFIKGSWILRKSYKYYQTAYNTILDLYKQIVGDDNIPSASYDNLPGTTPTTTSLEYPTSIEEMVELASDMERKDPIDVAQMTTSKKQEDIETHQSITIVSASLGNMKSSLTDVHQLNVQPSITNEPPPSSTVSKNQNLTLKNGYISSKSSTSSMLSSRPKPSISFHSGLKNGFVSPELRNVGASNDFKFQPNMKKSTSANSGLGGNLNFSPTSFFNFPFEVFNVNKA